MTRLFDDANNNGGHEHLFIATPINIRIVTPPPPAFRSLCRGLNYEHLREIINSSASLSPNEATHLLVPVLMETSFS